MSGYSDYYLKSNPFPETAVCDPSSSDPRLNGTIFNQDIFTDKIDELRARTAQKVNLIYISGNQYDRGLGKSALMIHQFNALNAMGDATCVYVRCIEKDKPVDVARKIILKWHDDGCLWGTFKKSFIAYSEADGDPLVTSDAVRMMFKDHPSLPNVLPISLYTHIRDVSRKINGFVGWLGNKLGMDARPLTALFGDYLSGPSQLPDTLSGRNVDTIAMYHSCLKVFGAYGYSRHYVFLDQFEDMVMGISKSKISSFALGMKNLLSGSKSSSIFVTLHPNSEMKLKLPSARDLTGVAPFDTFHRVNLLTLDIAPEKAVSLAGEYINFFREGGDPPYPTYPFEPELLIFIWYFNKGIIRNYLQKLNYALEYGVMSGCPELTFEYACEHQSEVLGQEITSRMMDAYNRWRGKPVAPAKEGRSWGSAIKAFKERKP